MVQREEADQVVQRPEPGPNPGRCRHGNARIGAVATILALALFGAACSSNHAPARSASDTTNVASTGAPSSTAGGAGQLCSTQAQPPGTPGSYSEGSGGTTFTLSLTGCNWSLTARGHNQPIDGTWTYAATTKEIAFTEKEGLCGPVTGTYTWAVSGNDLTMNLVSDTCTARTEQFAGVTWHKT